MEIFDRFAEENICFQSWLLYVIFVETNEQKEKIEFYTKHSVLFPFLTLVKNEIGIFNYPL